MTTASDDALQMLQREVQQLLGQCLLRLQRYEHLIKMVVAHHEISGPAHSLETVQAARIAGTARKTLGTLIGDLLGSYVISDEIGIPAETTTDLPEHVNSFRSPRPI